MEQRSVHLSNSIDKLRQPLSSSSSKILKLNSTNIPKQYPEKFAIDKMERLKSAKGSGEKVQRLNAKDIPESNSDKMRKLRSDKNSSNHTIDNSIDKNGRLLVAAKSSKLNYQNLKRSKMLLPECFQIPKVLPASSSHIDEYNYEESIFEYDDFEDYSDDFEEDTETDNNKSESSDRESSTEKSNIGRSDKIVNNESYDNSPLLRRIMNHQQSDNSQVN
ncbi:unnamed protein product [Brugia pahangi]|uniref:Uncharacterized protein n=1 Tax=Brugia pahangi TaxID=6280 RepID=A0A0N4TPU6_BRUPA|nr:unnamed protein product [Brugia pahangi]